MKGIFVAGTDTGVGKTEIVSLVIREMIESGQKVGAYKPVCSGAIENSKGEIIWEDVERMKEALGFRYADEMICPQRFRLPMAPPFAAQAEDKNVDEWELVEGVKRWEGKVDYLIMEGAGGLLSPISERMSNGDFARKVGCPVLLVGKLGLGTINHTLLSLNYCESKRIPVAGVILSETCDSSDDPSTVRNLQEIAKRTTHPVFGYYPFQKGLKSGEMESERGSGLIRNGKGITIDWSKVADEIIFSEGN